jgi:hypothetical protein
MDASFYYLRLHFDARLVSVMMSYATGLVVDTGSIQLYAVNTQFLDITDVQLASFGFMLVQACTAANVEPA